jgi:ABC-type transport system substrate-binding protein
LARRSNSARYSGSGDAAVWAALALAVSSVAAVAQKPGGILKIPHGDSPASMSIHEESTIVSEGPMMAVFNNLVMFDQHNPQNRLDTIVPDLAVGWSWTEDGTTLAFKLRQGHCQVEAFWSEYRGARTVIMPRWSRCAIARRF